MAKGLYLGVGSVAKKVKKAYIGVNGVARKIKKIYVGVNGVARLAWSGSTLAEIFYRSASNDYGNGTIDTDGNRTTIETGDWYIQYHNRNIYKINGYLYRAKITQYDTAGNYYQTEFQKKKAGAPTWTTFRTLIGNTYNRYAYYMSYCEQDNTVTISRVEGYAYTQSQSMSGTMRVTYATISASTLETADIENLNYLTCTGAIDLQNGHTIGYEPIVYHNNGVWFIYYSLDYFNGSNTSTTYSAMVKNGSLAWASASAAYYASFGKPTKIGNYYFTQNYANLRNSPPCRVSFTNASTASPSVTVFTDSSVPPKQASNVDGQSSAGANFFLNGGLLVYIVVTKINVYTATVPCSFELKVYTTADGVTWTLRTTTTSPSMGTATTTYPYKFQYLGDTDDEWLFFCNSMYESAAWNTSTMIYAVSKKDYTMNVKHQGAMNGWLVNRGFLID